MKKLFLFFMSMFVFGGCAAMYGNEAQYDEGDWHLFASSREVARIKQDKLALKKLISENQAENTVVLGDDNNKILGFPGAIFNLSSQNVLFSVSGPETKSWFLKPGETINDNLISGLYMYKIENKYGPVRTTSNTFRVCLQKNNFRGELYYWYIFYED